jgi:Domain of unknown function (DUF1877)
MSRTAAFVALSKSELEKLLVDPASVGEFFLEHLEAQDKSQVLDIDKSWHGIHFLLTGEQHGGEPPASLPVLGGVEFGPEISYGAARYLTADQVKEAAAHLAATPVERLKERYQPQALEDEDIYPTGMWESEGDQAFDYLAHWYELLRSFYARAATRDQAMLLAIV